MSHPLLILSFILSFVFPAHPTMLLQDNPAFTVEIFSPLPGEAVQGLAQITGTVDAANFQSYQLEFAFGDSTTQTWFPITQNTTPIIEGVLGEWDTSVLADRNYDLRLTVKRSNGEPIVVVVEGLRVRNYSPIETATPQPTTEDQGATPTPQETPTHTAPPSYTPTPLPENQAAVGPERVRKAVLNGALFGISFSFFWLIYNYLVNKNDK